MWRWKMEKSNNAVKAVKEPLFHISKRGIVPTWEKVLTKALTILCAFAFAGILSQLLIGVDLFTFIKTLFEGTFSTEKLVWASMKNLAILLGISLALAPAFKMHFWNTGAEGQVLMGGLATAGIMHYFGADLQNGFLIYLLMFIAGISVGALWAWIPAYFKAHFNTNETLFTLMMNYVATQLVRIVIDIWVKDGSGTLKNRTHLRGIRLPKIAGHEELLTILIVVAVAVAVYIYLRYSKHGYELAVVGESENTARYIGIDVKKVIIRTMLLSGAICGLMGVLLVGSLDGTVHPTDTVAGRGFTGIIVCWLGQFNPLFMILTAFLLIFIDRGVAALNLNNHAFSSLISGVVIFVIIGCEFFLNYSIKRCKYDKSKGKPTQSSKEAK